MSRQLEYLTKTDIYVISGGITYDVDENTINYIVPVCPGSKYTITMSEIGNRLRSVFTTTNPMKTTSNISKCVDIVMNPEFSVGYTFSYTPSSFGYIVVYVSSVGEYPKITIETDGLGGDAEYSVACNEVNSGTSLSCEVYAKASDWVLATVTTRSNTTFSEGWEILHESGQIGDIYQRMFFLSKQCEEDGFISIDVTQSTSARIYINLISIPDILGFQYHEGSEFLEGVTEINTIVLNKPRYQFIIWGCSANLWSTASPYNAWACDDLIPISLGNTVQRRQANFIDKGTSEQRTFSLGSHTSFVIIDFVEAVQYTKKYLIRAGNALYTIADGVLTQIEEVAISANVFQEKGFDVVPTWEVINSLANPEVLLWYNTETSMPFISSEMVASPFQQTIISDKIDMSNSTILGIEAITIDCDGSPLIAVSFDNKSSWKAYDGTQWVELSSEFSGMSKEIMEAITVDQWSDVKGSALEMFIRVALTNKEQIVRQIYIDFLN